MYVGPWEKEPEENAVVSIFLQYGLIVNVILSLEGLRWVFQNQKHIDSWGKFQEQLLMGKV